MCPAPFSSSPSTILLFQCHFHCHQILFAVDLSRYNDFYKAVSKDYLEPLAYTHFNAEGEIEFKSILYIPKKAPMDMMDNYWTKK